MIQFNKPPSSKPKVDNFSDKNPFEPGSCAAATFDKGCRDMRRSRLLSSDAAYTREDVAFLNDSMKDDNGLD